MSTSDSTDNTPKLKATATNVAVYDSLDLPIYNDSGNKTGRICNVKAVKVGESANGKSIVTLDVTEKSS